MTEETRRDFCRLDPLQADDPPQELDLALLDARRHETTERLRAPGASGRLPEDRTFVAEALLRWADDRGGDPES